MERHHSLIGSRNQNSFCVLLALLLAAAGSTFGQTAEQQTTIPHTAPVDDTVVKQRIQASYFIGPDDVLEIKVSDAPEISGRYRVTDEGELTLPMLPAPFKISGLTTLDLAKRITDALKAAEILKDPVVTVFVEQYYSRSVMVLGSVVKPGIYSLDKPTSILELLSLAGGLTPTAGNTLTISHKATHPTEQNAPTENHVQPTASATFSVELGKLLSGKDPSLNVEAQPGDVLTVATAAIVYVVGAVVKPGGFALQDSKSGLSVLKALALAEGFKPDAKASHAIIVRRSTSGQDREEIPINLAQTMNGKLTDQMLQADDILFVPESSFKKGSRRVADAALSAASTAVGYGYGVRIH
jgi:polysaccharide export outer membrane protein